MENFIFDLDGTVLNSRVRWLHSLKQAIEAMHLPMPEDDVLISHFGQERLRVFQEIFDMDDDGATEAIGVFGSYMTKNGHLEEAFEGMIEWIESLYKKGKKLYICTARSQEHTEDAYLLFPILDHYFEDAFTSEREKGLYNKAIILKRGMQKHNMDAKKSIMFGDRGTDIIAANENDVVSVGASFGHAYEQELKHAGADYIAYDVEEMKNIVSTLES